MVVVALASAILHSIGLRSSLRKSLGTSSEVDSCRKSRIEERVLLLSQTKDHPSNINNKIEEVLKDKDKEALVK